MIQKGSPTFGVIGVIGRDSRDCAQLAYPVFSYSSADERLLLTTLGIAYGG
jgi:hypothetical protein